MKIKIVKDVDHPKYKKSVLPSVLSITSVETNRQITVNMSNHCFYFIDCQSMKVISVFNPHLCSPENFFKISELEQIVPVDKEKWIIHLKEGFDKYKVEN